MPSVEQTRFRFGRKSPRPGRRTLGLALLAIAGLVSFACSRSGGPETVHPRQRLFPGTASSSILDVLRQPARLTVFFHPDPERCTPEEMRAVRALDRLAEAFDDIAVYSVLPVQLEDFESIFGYRLPGELLLIDDEQFLAEGQVSPRPRLEVWNADGQPLLLRSLPPTIRDEEIYEEVLWSRSFTDPIPKPRG